MPYALRLKLIHQATKNMTKDTIFNTDHPPAGFTFDNRVAEVFDDMLNRSVPFYRQVMEMIAVLLTESLRPGDRVYDLGCSTGATIMELARRFQDRDISFVGLDNSPAMLAKARHKVSATGCPGNIRFMEQDLRSLELAKGAGAVIVNYTMQFLDPGIRPEFLRKIHAALRPGGVLVLSEKVVMRDPGLNRQFIDFYHAFKRAQGYSELEIAKKREALENVLIPQALGENRAMLQDAGFAVVETFFQWFNFVSFLAVR